MPGYMTERQALARARHPNAPICPVCVMPIVPGTLVSMDEPDRHLGCGSRRDKFTTVYGGLPVLANPASSSSGHAPTSAPPSDSEPT